MFSNFYASRALNCSPCIIPLHNDNGKLVFQNRNSNETVFKVKRANKEKELAER